MDERIFLLKAAALLHDPPHKTMIMKIGLDHEKVADRYFSQLFGHEHADFLKSDYIHEADALSASSDRQIVLHAMGGSWIPSFKAYFEITYKSPINPLFEHRVFEGWDRVDFESYLEEADKGFEELVEKLKDTPIIQKYFIFYLFWEYTWLKNQLPQSPADTRVPTFTAMDHGYATASALNFILFGARLALLDIAGVQKFISHSRKLRDAWVSSYLVSALLWYTISELIFQFGPDVVIIPSMRLNPFLAHALAKRYPQHSALLEPIVWGSPILEEKPRIYDRLKMPLYPVMPGKALIIVPKGWKGGFKKRFEEGWKLLVRGAKLLAEKKAEGSPIWRFVKEAFEYMDREMPEILEKPPLKLRYELSDMEIRKAEDYSEALLKLQKKVMERKTVREEPEAEVNLEGLTSRAFSGPGLGFPRASRRGFDYCTTCGRMPAAVIMPPDEEYEAEMGAILGESPSALKYFFSPGERLCPWCFLKRVISLEPRLLRILLDPVEESQLEVFIQEIAEVGFDKLFPSTVHVALAEAVSRQQTAPMQSSTPSGEEIAQWMWGFADELAKSNPIAASILDRIDEDVYEGKGAANLLKKEYVWRYYALVRADADSMGKLMSGDMTALWNPVVGKRVSELTLKSAKFVLEASTEGAIRDIIKEKLERGDYGGIIGSREDPCVLLEEEREKHITYFIKPTLSYHTIISASLMKAALMDIKIINALKGFVVYAGGDDLLALLPLSTALQAVEETRKHFSTSIETLGFPYVFLLSGIGRSYSLIVAHYRYPLSAVIDVSSALLDHAKDKVLYHRGNAYRKDILVLHRVPGGSTVYLPLAPYRSIEEVDGELHGNAEKYLKYLAAVLRPMVNILNKMKPLAEAPTYSRNLLTDAKYIYRELEVLAMKGKPDIMRSLLVRLISRNVPPRLREGAKIEWLGEWAMDDELLTSWIEDPRNRRGYYLPVQFFEALKIVAGGMH